MTTLSFLGVAHIHIGGFVGMLKKRSDLRVTAVYDADPVRRAHWAKETGAKEVETVGDAIDAADAVVITSQTSDHAALVEAVTKAGKAIFVEKPLGMAAVDAYAMAAAIDKSGKPFQTGYFMRSQEPVRAIKTLIDNGELGQITKVFAANAHPGAIGDWFKAKPNAKHEEWRWMADEQFSGVGGFGDLGTHVLDILLWWMGDVTSVTAQIDKVTNTYGCDESGQGMLRFENGAIGTLAAGWVDAGNPVRFLVSGTKGHAAVIGGKLFVTKGDNVDFAAPVTDLPPAAGHAFELFLDKISGNEPIVPLVTAQEAAYRSAVMEAMYQGAKTNTWVTPKKG